MSESTRLVYRLKAGDLRRLKISEELLAEPGSLEVQVNVKSIGLNFADIFAILGLYSATPKEAFIPGLEFSGIIEKRGDKVNGYEVGDRVIGVTRFGAYSNRINLDVHYILPLPPTWNFNEGAAFSVQALTAYYGLFNLGNLQNNQTVLIHSGAGGVGIFANRMAKTKMAFTIGTTSSPDKIGLMQQEGYNRIIVRSNLFKKDLNKALQDRSLNLIMECIGGGILKTGFEKLAPEGRMVVYGSASFNIPGNKPNIIRMLPKYLRRPKIDPLTLPTENKSIMGFNLIWLYEQHNKMKEVLGQINRLKLDKPYVGHIYKFEEILEAVQKFRSGKTTGKVIIAL